jgi:ADP-heptose:LPS heptosyltransferase
LEQLCDREFAGDSDMNVDTLRILDRFIGIPLCGMLTAARWVEGIVRRGRSLAKPRKVLVIKLSEMGSTVLAYPAIIELKKRCPEVELFFLVFKNNAAIVDILDIVPAANVTTVDMGSPSRLLISGFAAMRRLLRERIDTTFDMDFFSRFTAVISFLVCRENRVGFDRYTDEGLYRGNLLTHRVLYSPHVHTSVAFMALIRTIFEESTDEPHYRSQIDPSDFILPRYVPAVNDAKKVCDKLKAAGICKRDHQPIILVNPNSSDIFPLRKWPLSFFTQLCEKLLKAAPSCWLVITGVASEHKDACYILEGIQSSRCIDFTGKTDLRELLALYSMAAVMVTNDSGPAHFASLLRLPTVVLFGPETPRLYSPIGNRHRDLYANFSCSPCVSVYNGKKSSCQENRCLKAMSVDYVLKETLALLGEAEKVASTVS